MFAQKVYTDENGYFNLQITPAGEGEWIITASWAGDNKHLGVTATRVLKVYLDWLPYQIAGLGLTIAIAVAVLKYKSKILKPKR